MKKYATPDFDVTIYELDDIITADGYDHIEDVTIGPEDPNEGEWWG